jgi:L-alanine-DL-glutamate epimerase-like enolase superfamily enzyme
MTSSNKQTICHASTRDPFAETGMPRRRFLALTTSIVAGAALPSLGAEPSPAAEPLAKHRIADLEMRSFPLLWPRQVGRNAKLGIHGRGPTVTAVVLKTDQGAEGWGCVEGARGNGDEWRQMVKGKTVAEVFSPGRGITNAGLKPLDIALHDLAGVILGLPVWNMLGASKPHLYPVYSGMIYFDDLDPEEKPAGIDQVLKNCEADRTLGYRQLKVKIGRGNKWMAPEAGLKRDVEVVQAVFKAFPDCEILVDANDGYNADTFIQFLKGIEGIPLFWIEEPFVENEGAWRKVHEWTRANGRASTLLADGEQNNDFPLLEKLEAAGILNVRLTDIIGHGFTRWREWMPRLLATKTLASPHAWGSGLKSVYAAHLLAGLGNGCSIEGVTCNSDQVDFGENVIGNGKLQVSSKPGFGVKLLRSAS